jgi:hypothetical protein
MSTCSQRWPPANSERKSPAVIEPPARVDGAATASLIAAGGQLGYTARADGQISAWALDHLRGSVPLRVFTPRAQAPFELVELAGPPEAGRLAVGYPDGEIVIVDELGRRVGAHKVSADALGFRLLGSPDGRYLAVSVDAGPESEVFVLTLADGARRRLSGAPIRSWLWLDDGALAIASEKFEVEIFDVAAGTRQAPIVDRLGLRASRCAGNFEGGSARAGGAPCAR